MIIPKLKIIAKVVVEISAYPHIFLIPNILLSGVKLKARQEHIVT
jgi:hypothetical protein